MPEGSEIDADEFREKYLHERIEREGARPSKYKNEHAEYNGRVYHSKAEAAYAMRLDAEKSEGLILWWIPQVRVMLGDVPYVMDFLVQRENFAVSGVDVKGFETPKFKLQKKLWRKYMSFPLEIVRNGKVVEAVT